LHLHGIKFSIGSTCILIDVIVAVRDKLRGAT
jgi:hypothetical protein